MRLENFCCLNKLTELSKSNLQKEIRKTMSDFHFECLQSKGFMDNMYIKNITSAGNTHVTDTDRV